jgi:hypothetical protein
MKGNKLEANTTNLHHLQVQMFALIVHYKQAKVQKKWSTKGNMQNSNIE